MARKVKDCPRNDYYQNNSDKGELFRMLTVNYLILMMFMLFIMV